MDIAYIGPFSFNSTHASALRVRGISYALASAGARVFIATTTVFGQTYEAFDPEPGVVEVHRKVNSVLRTARGLRALTDGYDTYSWLDSLPTSVAAVLVYGTDIKYLLPALKWTRKHGVPLVLDVVEWYESSHLPLGRWGPFAIANHVAMNSLSIRADKVLAISSYLASHYNRHAIPTLIVPPLFRIDHAIPRSTGSLDGRIQLAYVGIPAKKDRITIENLIMLSREPDLRKDIKITLGGPTIASLIETGILRNSTECGDLEARGVLNRRDALNLVASSSFTVLQRPPQRYAQAGFPSKVAESVLLGTPVLSNLTSDLNLYLEDRINSIHLADSTYESLVSGVRVILDQKPHFNPIEISARASKAFSPRSHGRRILDFLMS